MSGLEVGAAAVGVASLGLQSLEGCFKGFALLTRLWQCDRDAPGIRLTIAIELCRFCDWAYLAGLTGDNPELRIIPRYRNLVPIVLKQLEELMTDINKLRTVYGLEIEVLPEEIIDIRNFESAFARLKLNKQPSIQGADDLTEKVFARRVRPWLRVRWVAVDEARFKKILKQIDKRMAQLGSFLDVESCTRLQNSKLDVVRRTVTSTGNDQDLETIVHSCQASYLSIIKAVAKVKLKRVRLGVDEDLNSLANTPPRNPADADTRGHKMQNSMSRIDAILDGSASMRLSSKADCFQFLSPPGPYESRQFSYYQGQPVLLEWRPVIVEQWASIMTRIEKLACLLHSMTHPTFHSLNCLGWVDCRAHGGYAYVFSLPSGPTINPTIQIPSVKPMIETPMPSIESLRNMFDSHPDPPSLNVRLTFSIIILETLLQLHTAGLLHKAVRSDNILLIRGVSQALSDEIMAEHQLFLGGYAYTRSTGQDEFTESIVATMEAGLYRHPTSLRGDVRYKKTFDLFSIGCVLLELGLWSSMFDILTKLMKAEVPQQPTKSVSKQPTVLTPPSSPDCVSAALANDGSTTDLALNRSKLLQQFRDTSSLQPGNPDDIYRLLQARMGKAYTQVVVDHLTAESMLEQSTSGSHTEAEKSSAEDFFVQDLTEKNLSKLRALSESL